MYVYLNLLISIYLSIYLNPFISLYQVFYPSKNYHIYLNIFFRF